MLCKATEADLEQMVAFRRKTYGGTRQDALDWLCGIVVFRFKVSIIIWHS